MLSYVTGGPDFFWGGENSVNLGTSKRKLRFYDDFKCPEKIIENFNFLSAKNVYLGVTGLTIYMIGSNVSNFKNSSILMHM